MNRRTPLLITSMVTLPLLVLLALRPATAQAAGWSGWARCEISTRGSGYEQTDTHTWFVNNAAGNTPATLGSGSWQVTGRGNISQGDPSQTLMRGEWAINGASTAASNAQFGVVPLAGGLVSIRPFHTQLKTSGGIQGYVQQTINNSAREATPVTGTAWEWQFPAVQGSATGPTIAGSSSGNHTGIGWAFNQASNSTIASSCQWLFANGSTPPPPPPIAATPVPVTPRIASQYPWSGTVECDVTVTATGYQDQQLHTWTLMRSQPSASGGGVYVHPVIWRVQGSGGFQQRVGKRYVEASWKTAATDKAPFSMFVRTSDNKLIIRPAQTPRRVPGGIHGSQQTTFGHAQQAPVPISLEAVEWSLPVLEADANEKGFKGKSSPQITGPVSPMQPTGANVLCNCTWRLSRGP